jgi:23S rRNA (uracil1939-C5)-methyltransferase
MARRNKKMLFKNLKVIDTGAKGKSVAKTPDGRVVFIADAVPGDIVNVETFKKRKNYYEGKITQVIEYSEKRVEPKCSYFGTCGGCKWQNMSYEHQLFFKQKEVENNLKRIGKIEIPLIQPIMGSENEYYYRNKMEFSFSDSKWLTLDQIQSEMIIENKNALGLHIPGMWDKVLDISECHLQLEPSNSIRNFIKSKAEELLLPFFNTRNQNGLLRTLMIRTSSNGEIMVLIQFYKDDKTKREELMNAIANNFPEITSLLYVINSKANDTLYDQDIICHSGRDHIFEEMEELKFKINAKSFYQTNSGQAFELYKVVRDFANLSGDELVYDLYTGTGTIAQFLSKEAKNIVGIESVPEAIDAAIENTKMNAIDNIKFKVGDMKKVLNREFIEENGVPDLVVTDPPRDGMHKEVVNQLIELAPNKIVYVSCNSATQARDLALLDHTYEVKKIQPVDMFPQTHHVENVVLLEKR